MNRLPLKDKALIVALDHARTLGALDGLENPGRVLKQVIEAGADGVMTSYGVVKRYRELLIGRVPTFLRLDGGPSSYREDWLKYTEWSLLHTVEDARALGVDGVCVMCFLGGDVELDTFNIVARVVGDCQKDGLPVMVEALPSLDTPRIRKPLAPEAMASAARIAFEHGADIVKTYYTGTAEGFKKVTVNCPVPVLVAGGAKMDTVEAALTVVYGAMQGGAQGVVFGRNIWQNADIPGVMASLRAIIHQGATVEQAMKEFGKV
jgi:DhnA family fructose-bisphosphate aldolase class Ia